jgi:drug/metabolite transporter (DMT)-like permease
VIFLLFSILSSVGIFLLFKQFERWGVDTFQAIVFNYITAFTMGMLATTDDGGFRLLFSQDWHLYPFLLGLTFIGLFYLMAVTAQKMGVSVASIATKMSLVIAVAVFVIIDPNEKLTALDVVAICLAVVGVFMASAKTVSGGLSAKWVALPVIIFLGSGLVDVTLGIFSDDQYMVRESDHYLLSALPFGAAAGCGVLIQIYRIVRGISQSQLKSLLAGIVLGAVNFGSIFFLVRVLNADVLEKSSIIPINNMGVVVLSALLGLALFKERLTVKNWVGVLCSVVAISLLLL